MGDIKRWLNKEVHKAIQRAETQLHVIIAVGDTKHEINKRLTKASPKLQLLWDVLSLRCSVIIYQMWSKEGTVVNQWQGELRSPPVVQSIKAISLKLLKKWFLVLIERCHNTHCIGIYYKQSKSKSLQNVWVALSVIQASVSKTDWCAGGTLKLHSFVTDLHRSR